LLETHPDPWRVQQFSCSVEIKSLEKYKIATDPIARRQSFPALRKHNHRRKCPIAADPTAKRRYKSTSLFCGDLFIGESARLQQIRLQEVTDQLQLL